MAPQIQPGPTGRVVSPGLVHSSTVGVAGASPTGGTITTPNGPITWTQSTDGTINAEGGGQKLLASGQNQSDGSFQKHATYARTGQAPYLTMDLVRDVAQHKAALTLTAGSSANAPAAARVTSGTTRGTRIDQPIVDAATSRLTVTVTNIDAHETSGTATLSGRWNGVAVNWTGQANLTSNPLTHRIAGWPAGAFTTQVKQTQFFAPLEILFVRAVVSRAPTPHGGGSGSGGLHIEDDTAGQEGRAVAWCVGGIVANAGSGPLGMILGCAGGAGASLLSDLASWLWPNIPDEPTPNPDLPLPDPYEPPDTQTQPDDSGSGGAGGSSTHKGDDDTDTGEKPR
jgi:hypothetical protein